MCLGDSYKHENSKDNEAQLGMYVLSDKEEKGGTVLDFKSENGWFTANWGTAEHAEAPPPTDQNYLLEGGTLVVQASPARWVF